MACWSVPLAYRPEISSSLGLASRDGGYCLEHSCPSLLAGCHLRLRFRLLRFFLAYFFSSSEIAAISPGHRDFGGENLRQSLGRQTKVFRLSLKLLPVGLMPVGSVEPVFNRVKHGVRSFCGKGRMRLHWPCSYWLAHPRGLIVQGRIECANTRRPAVFTALRRDYVRRDCALDQIDDGGHNERGG